MPLLRQRNKSKMQLYRILSSSGGLYGVNCSVKCKEDGQVTIYRLTIANATILETSEGVLGNDPQDLKEDEIATMSLVEFLASLQQ